MFGNVIAYISQTNPNPNKKDNQFNISLSEFTVISFSVDQLGKDKIFNPIYIAIDISATKTPALFSIVAKLQQTQYQLTYLYLGSPIHYTFLDNKQNYFCFQIAQLAIEGMSLIAVSYTHLTLPTKRIVQISGVVVNLKKKKYITVDRKQ
eukprot:TRINITY_DN39738_c0_g1_i1.p1 TRINITY_DN39738_c0_g1~~TRINITY_DN39738_c0_g1_i1.p1  ORF type:complete len:150 (+),score=21.10 TRINITY_DN39738_c0_g1_i1:228-677(+)